MVSSLGYPLGVLGRVVRCNRISAGLETALVP